MTHMVRKWRTMSLRRAAAILALTLLSSCTIPRTGIVVGTGTMITGGALLAQTDQDDAVARCLAYKM